MPVLFPASPIQQSEHQSETYTPLTFNIHATENLYEDTGKRLSLQLGEQLEHPQPEMRTIC